MKKFPIGSGCCLVTVWIFLSSVMVQFVFSMPKLRDVPMKALPDDDIDQSEQLTVTPREPDSVDKLGEYC